MAFTDVIARLAVSLNLDTAAFTTGSRKAKAEVTGMKGHMTKAVAAIGAAFAGIQFVEAINAFRDMTKAAIDSTKQIERSAQLANAGVEEFQKAAYAARSVGIEGEKLADIYKDVNDKFGDFLATGGGELKDFFDNIAPKVGVTAAQFAKLSGPEALQLYVSSLEKAGVNQQQMTFYMEALANDTTALLPLLKDGGKAMGEYAASAEKLGLVMSPEEIAKAKELANNLSLLNAQIEAQQNKKLLENADTLIKYEQVVGGLKLTFIEAIASIADWNDTLDEVDRQLGTDIPSIKGYLNSLGEAIVRMEIDTKVSMVRFAVNMGTMLRSAADVAISIPTKLGQMGAAAIAAVGRMVDGIRAAIGGRLSAVWDSAKAKIEQVRQSFFNLWDKVTRRSYVPDMVDDIAREMARLDGVMVDPALRATDRVKESMRDMARETKALLDRLFPEIGAALAYRNELALIEGSALGEGQKSEARARLGREALGIDPAADVPVSVANDNGPLVDFDTGDVLRGIEGIGAATETVKKGWLDLKSVGATAFGEISHQLQGVILGAQSFADALRNVIARLADMALSAAFRSLGAGLGLSIPGFAKGTRSAPGGLALVGERGPELVNLPRGSRVFPNDESRRMIGGRAGDTYNIHVRGPMSESERRETGRQVAASIGQRQAAARRAGLAG